MIEFNVLITGAGTTNAISVLKGLKAVNDPSIAIYMGDINPNCAGAHLGDNYVRMPAADDPAFEKKVVEICKIHKIDLVIPTIDYEFLRWSRLKKQLLPMGTRVVISDPGVIETCRNKDLTIQYFKNIGVPCPPTWHKKNIKDAKKLPYPVFIKPLCGRGSLNSYRVDNIDEFDYHRSKLMNFIVQPYLFGDEVTIDTMSDFHGSFLEACPRTRLEIKSGQAYKSITIDAPKLVEYAKRIVESLPIIGPANIQCFVTDDEPTFFEINPRFGAGTILSIRAGLNGPAALAAMARNKTIPDLKSKKNVLMLRYWQEVFVDRNDFSIFFDLDGPILDVSRRHYEVYRSILEEAKMTAISSEQYWAEKRARTAHSKILSYTTDLDFYDTFVKQWFIRIENEKFLAFDRVWPWVPEILSELYKNHSLYLITVRSNQEQLNKQLDRFNLSRWFKTVLCRPSTDDAAKEKIKAIRDYFQKLPSRAIIVGDTEADIECGNELGFTTIGVLSGIRNKYHLKETKCDFILDTIESLPGLVMKLEEVAAGR